MHMCVFKHHVDSYVQGTLVGAMLSVFVDDVWLKRVLTMLERSRLQSNSIDLSVCAAKAREEVAIAGLPASSAVPGSHSPTACEGSAYGRDHASLCWGSVCEESEASMSCWSPPGTSLS